VISRKFGLALYALTSLNALLAFHLLDGSQYITGMIATVGAYLTANVLERKP
jgi:hypothetical protein